MWEEILFNGVAPEDALAAAQATLEKDLSGKDFVSSESLYPFFSGN